MTSNNAEEPEMIRRAREQGFICTGQVFSQSESQELPDTARSFEEE